MLQIPHLHLGINCRQRACSRRLEAESISHHPFAQCSQVLHLLLRIPQVSLGRFCRTMRSVGCSHLQYNSYLIVQHSVMIILKSNYKMHATSVTQHHDLERLGVGYLFVRTYSTYDDAHVPYSRVLLPKSNSKGRIG